MIRRRPLPDSGPSSNPGAREPPSESIPAARGYKRSASRAHTVCAFLRTRRPTQAARAFRLMAASRGLFAPSG